MQNMQAAASQVPDECLWPADDNDDVCDILAHLSPLFLVSFAFTHAINVVFVDTPPDDAAHHHSRLDAMVADLQAASQDVEDAHTASSESRYAESVAELKRVCDEIVSFLMEFGRSFVVNHVLHDLQCLSVDEQRILHPFMAELKTLFAAGADDYTFMTVLQGARMRLAHAFEQAGMASVTRVGTFYYADFMQNVDDVVAHELSMCVYHRYTQRPDLVDDLLARYEQAGIPPELLSCTDARVRQALGIQARDL